MLLRFFHIALALLLFASSAGANLSIHYCGGEIAKWALFIKSDDCGMPQHDQKIQVTEADTRSDIPQVNRTPCCQDELSYHKLDVEKPTQDADDADILHSELIVIIELTSARPTGQPASFPFSSLFVRPPPDPLQLGQRLAQLNVRLL